MSSSAAIAVSDLTVARGGRQVLSGLTLAIRSGAVTGLLGPSGCGKSTLMRSIVGVQIVASGDGHGARGAGRVGSVCAAGSAT